MAGMDLTKAEIATEWGLDRPHFPALDHPLVSLRRLGPGGEHATRRTSTLDSLDA
jgi:hypothetical protein